jgi:hypothetical protein
MLTLEDPVLGQHFDLTLEGLHVEYLGQHGIWALTQDFL